MSGVITMPRMGETMESGRVSAWLKRPGDTFERGETIAEIETDKVTVDMPALDAGRLTEILVPEGGEVAVGTALGRYDAAGGGASKREPPKVPAGAGRRLAEVTLPRMGETMEEGRVAAWLKAPGQSFRRGEMLAEIETDKVTVEMPALADGELVDILVAEGESVPVGTPIARYAPIGGADVEPSPAQAPEALAEARQGDEPRTVARGPAGDPAASVDRRRTTPLARRLARQAGLDLSSLPGSGRRGRIEKSDVEEAVSRQRQGAPASEEAASSLPPLGFVAVDRGRMAYREWVPASAARRVVLLLHGFSAEGATWAAVAANLARNGARVVAADLPGHGATTIAAPDFATVCDAVAEFAQALGLERPHVLGHSMGGAVAVRLAAEGRLQPAALTLIAPAGLGGEIDADFVRGMAAVTTGGGLAHLLRRLARRPPTLSRPQLDAMAGDLAKGRLRDLATALAPEGRQGIDVVADLAAIEVPTRLVWGVADRILPWTQVAAAPSRTAIHLIADAGHMPHWDRPQDLAALLV